MKTPLISVIIPVYKVEQYLPECLESIVNQTYKNLEIICVDDGSPDNSGRILDEYASKDNRIKVIHKENGGVSSARNAGLDIAKGDWISFVDSDDWLDVNTYEKLLSSINDTSIDIVMFGNCSVNNGIYAKYKNINADSTRLNDYSYLLLKLGGLVTDKLFKRSLIEENKLRFVEHISISEDGLFNAELLLQYPKIQVLDECFYYYRIYRPDSTISGQHSLDRELSIRDYMHDKDFYKKASVSERMVMDIKVLHNMIFRYERLTEENKLKNINFLKEYGVYFNESYSPRDLSQFKQIKHLKKLIKLNGKEESFITKMFSVKNSKDKTKKVIRLLGLRFQVQKGVSNG